VTSKGKHVTQKQNCIPQTVNYTCNEQNVTKQLFKLWERN